MASASMPLTPEPASYSVVHTPRHGSPTVDAKPSWISEHWYIGSIAQLIALGSLALYYAAAAVYLTPYYWKIDPKLAVWWGVPSEEELEADPTVSPGHAEMTLPTYLFLGLFAPTLLAMVAVWVLRRFNVRRLTSRYVLQVAMALRRKPVLLGRLSPFGYGELIFLVVFLIGGNVFVSWYQYDAYIAYVADAGRELTLDVYLGQIGLLFGYTCVWNMAFLFLPATRNCVWMELLGISYANGVKYHRWCGVMVVLTGVLHTIPYYWIWLRDHEWVEEALPCFTCSVYSEEKGRGVWFNVYGELALICFLVLAFGSLPWVRRRMYESFYYVHHLFIPGVVFTVLHWPTTTWFIFPSFLVYLIDRAVSSSNAFWPIQVREFTVLPDGIVQIVLARSEHDDGAYAIGQFVYLNAPAVSKLQWHPFTIASSPKSSKRSFTVLLKSLGDWTKELETYVEQCNATNVSPTLYVDGYYGESLEKYREYSTVCLVAGGIGVTPILAILEDLVASLSYANAEPRQRVFLVFTFRELSLLELLHPVLAQLRELDPREEFFTARLFLTRVPKEAALDRPIASVADQPAKSIGGSAPAGPTPTPFAQPLRSRGFKAVTFLIIMTIAVVLVAWLEYGDGKIVQGGEKPELWMVQYTVEIAVLFLATLVVYAVVLLERVVKQKSRRAGEAVESLHWENTTPTKPAIAMTDGHTLRHLFAAYNVVVGRRPDMSDLITEVNDGGKGANGVSGVVGVFMSGPETLKTATEEAIANAGAHLFDVHAEEFEL